MLCLLLDLLKWLMNYTPAKWRLFLFNGKLRPIYQPGPDKETDLIYSSNKQICFIILIYQIYYLFYFIIFFIFQLVKWENMRAYVPHPS